MTGIIRRRPDVLKQFLLIFIALSCFGCGAVYTRQPIGEEPRDLAAEKEGWDGTWLFEEGSIVVRVTDGPKGLLKIAWFEDKDGLKLETADVELRNYKNFTFASMKDAKKDLFYWGLIKKHGAVLLVWSPDLKKFKNLVSEKKLPGVIEGSDVILGDLGPAELELITSEAQGVLFNWMEPMVFYKVSK